jgi:hypothetical protein
MAYNPYNRSKTMPAEPRPLKVYGAPGPGKGRVLFQAMTACHCGCGLKARFEFMVGNDGAAIDDPEAIRALIEEMAEGYRLLFPDEKQPHLPEVDPT